jgi:hypothetical protein
MSLYASMATWCLTTAGWTAVVISPLLVLGTASVIGQREEEKTRHLKKMNDIREQAERIRLGIPSTPPK